MIRGEERKMKGEKEMDVWTERRNRGKLVMLSLAAVVVALLVWPMAASADPSSAQGYVGGLRYEEDLPDLHTWDALGARPLGDEYPHCLTGWACGSKLVTMSDGTHRAGPFLVNWNGSGIQVPVFCFDLKHHTIKTDNSTGKNSRKHGLSL